MPKERKQRKNAVFLPAFVTAESLAKRERDEALVDAVLNRDNAYSAAAATTVGRRFLHLGITSRIVNSYKIYVLIV